MIGLHRAARQEDPGDAHRLQLRNVDVRDDAADEHAHVVETLLAQQLHQPRADVHVRAAQDRQADDVGILLQRGRGDLLGRLPQAGIDHLHAGIPQRAGDDLGAAVVAVEARFGDHHSRFAHQISCPFGQVRFRPDPACHSTGRGPEVVQASCLTAMRVKLAQIDGASSYSPQTSRRALHISPTVA